MPCDLRRAKNVAQLHQDVRIALGLPHVDRLVDGSHENRRCGIMGEVHVIFLGAGLQGHEKVSARLDGRCDKAVRGNNVVDAHEALIPF